MTGNPLCLKAVLSFWLLLAALAAVQHAAANENASDVRPGDEVWLISARGDDSCGVAVGPMLPCQSYCDGCWRPEDCDAIYHRQPECNMKTVVFVHGYRTDLDGARKLGMEVYANLFLDRSDACPICFVVWAWRSEAESRRPLQDFSLKSQRAIELGDLFAMTLNQLGSRPVTVIAYSLGTQIVISAAAQSNRYQGPPFRLAVIAAATDCGFSSHCQELSGCGNISCCWIFLNSDDRAIRAAKLACRLTYRRSYQTFEEFAPLHAAQLGEVKLVDITDVAGSKHSIVKYSQLPVVRACIEQMLAEESEGNPAPIGSDQEIREITASPTQAESFHNSPIRISNRSICTLR